MATSGISRLNPMGMPRSFSNNSQNSLFNNPLYSQMSQQLLSNP